MARVMLIGYGPLPDSNTGFTGAAALRTRQVLKPLLGQGHTVNLYTLPLPGTEGNDAGVPAMKPDSYEGFSFQRMTSHSGEFAIRMLSEQARQHQPDAIVGVSTYPAYIGAMLSTLTPLWADLSGYWMAEMQGRCHLESDDGRLLDAWAIEQTIVRRLDKFSAASRPHLHAVVGEMATAGRLNQYTFDYQFGHHMPNSGFRWSQGLREDDLEPVLRGPIVPADAFILLWSGSFAAWSDIEGLVTAMDRLMADYPEVHLVVTGGSAKGQGAAPYREFEERVDKSPYKSRFHMLGWIKPARLVSIYREADLGINVDAINYLTLFGGRTRINTMALEGLAMVSTLGTEVSDWFHAGRALLGAPLGDPHALADAIEPWIEQREELKFYAANALAIAQQDFSEEKTTEPLLEWLRSPALAPDNFMKVQRASGDLEDLNEVAVNPLEESVHVLSRFRPEDVREAIAEWEARRTDRPRRGFFGIGRNR